MRSWLRHVLDWLLLHSLTVGSLVLLIVLMNISLKLLIIVIISWILTEVSSSIMSLVEPISLIDELVGLLILLNDLKKRLQHLG